MATREKSFLEQRISDRIASKKEQRASNTEAYVQSLTQNPDNVMRPGVPRNSAELRARPIESPESLKASSRLNREVMMGNRSAAAREVVRERDELGRFKATSKTAAVTNDSLKTLKRVFKEQSDKLLRTLDTHHREQLKALGAISAKRGSGSGSFLDAVLGTDGPDIDVDRRSPRRRGPRRAPAARAGRGVLGRVGSLLGRGASALGGLGAGAATVLEGSGGAIGRGVLGAGRSVMGALGRGASAVTDLGARAVNVISSGGSGLGKSALSTVTEAGSALKGAVPSVSRALGGLVAPALGAYEAYGIVNDATKTTREKSLGVAGAAGGVAGGVLGGQMGALAGTAIMPGVGTVVGGALGGVAGYFGGTAFIGSVGNAVTTAVENSGAGEVLGRGMAVVMSPFSEDARSALKADWKENMGAMDKSLEPMTTLSTNLVDKLGDYTSALGRASVDIWSGVKAAASSVSTGAKAAGAAVAQGYAKDGVKGAVAAGPAAARAVGSSVGAGAAAIREGVASAGSTMKYAAAKGSSSALDLAMGFQAKKGITGLSDSQTKAYAGNVMKTESGGKLGITNQYGFAGQYQFGAEALADNGLIDTNKLAAAKKAAGSGWYKAGGHKAFMEDNSNWKNEGGRDAFLKDKQLQDDTFSSYTNRNIAGGFRKGKDGRSALNADSTPEQIAAFAKAAHLKGVGGANALIKNGVDSADANGTRTSKYAKDGADAMVTLASQVDNSKSKGGSTTVVAKSAPLTHVPAAPTRPVVATAATQSVAAQKAAVEAAKVTSQVPAAMTVSKPAAARTGVAAPVVSTSPTPSTTVATNAVAAAAPEVKYVAQATPTAQATPMPASLVNSSTPVEAQNVTVTNQVAPQQAQTPVASSNSGQRGGSSQPSLDEVPLQITDLGLVLLNIGHV